MKKGDGGQRKNSYPDTGRWLSGKSSHFHASSFIQWTHVPAYSFARLWDPRRWARAMWPLHFHVSTDWYPHTLCLPRWHPITGVLNRIDHKADFFQLWRDNQPVNCITVGCICCFLVQIFVKMTVPHCIHPHGLHLAVIYISQPIMHLSYVLH